MAGIAGMGNVAYGIRFGLKCQMNIGAMTGRMRMNQFALEKEIRSLVRDMAESILNRAVDNCWAMVYADPIDPDYEFTYNLYLSHYMRAADVNTISQIASGEAVSGGVVPSQIVGYLVGNSADYAIWVHDGHQSYEGRPWFQKAVDEVYQVIDKKFVEGTDNVWKGYLQA